MGKVRTIGMRKALTEASKAANMREDADADEWRGGVSGTVHLYTLSKYHSTMAVCLVSRRRSIFHETGAMSSNTASACLKLVQAAKAPHLSRESCVSRGRRRVRRAVK